MVKSELRSLGYDGRQKLPSRVVIGVMWLGLLIILIIAGSAGVFSAAAALGITSESELNLLQEFTEIIHDAIDIAALLVFFVIFMVIYLTLKYIAARLFCEEKNSLSVIMLKENVMPVCMCRETFRIWQMFLVYFAPVFLMYSLLFLLNVYSAFSVGFAVWSVNIILLSVFIAFDLSLAVYILYLKITARPDYISVDQHIYSLTLFYKTAVSTDQPQLEKIKTVTDPKKEERTAIPTAPGQFFLKLTGIFYIAAGIVIILSAVVHRYIDLGELVRENDIVTVVRNPSRFSSFLYNSAVDIMPVWNFTAANGVIAVFERFHLIAPDIQLYSISYFVSENPVNRGVMYSVILRWSADITIWGIILTYIAVITGIFVLFTGIIAVKYCDSLKRAKMLMIFALINLGIMVFSTISAVSFFAVLGCGIAALCFWGALQNQLESKNV